MVPVRDLVVCVAVMTLVAPSIAYGLPSIQDVFGNIWGRSEAVKKNKYEQQTKSRTRRAKSEIGDESLLPWEVKCSSLPEMPAQNVDGSLKKPVDTRFMPTLGSGLIGTTVYSDALYINGLYEGTGAETHRAKVPALMMTRVEFETEELEGKAIRTYTFNVKEGIFTEYIDCPFGYIWHKTYIHQKYIRVLVTDISAKRKDPQQEGQIILRYPSIDDTPDIEWTLHEEHFGNRHSRGRTKSAEKGVELMPVNIYYHNRLTSISLSGGNQYVNHTMIMSADILDSAAKSDFDTARNIINNWDRPHNNDLLMEHIAAWQKTWEKGGVELEGRLALSKLTWFSMYYLLSSMPPMYAAQLPKYNQVYYGPTRTSLGRGGKDKDYQGHMFWDTEVYLLPAVLMFYPEIAKYLLRYRSAKAMQAKELAESIGAKGYRFPWESAMSGYDVTPAGCTACKEKQIFVSGAVSWAIRQYYTATRDRDYLINPDYNGCVMTKEIAAFYASLAKYNSTKGRYDINNVMGPDDYHPGVNNNAFTNAVASLAIHWARYMACICNNDVREEVPDEFIQIALYLELPFDNVKRLHYQYEGYDKEKNETVKQADAILLSYPLNWNMSLDIMRNDLYFYKASTDHQTPAMTHSFMTVGWKWVQEESEMYNSFERSYQEYVFQPFKVWTEYQNEEKGSVNFLPGAGGFIQSLVYGFAGVRLRPEFLEFHNPIPPPDCDRIILRGFKYLYNVLDIRIEQDHVVIEVVLEKPTNLLTLIRNDSYSQEETLRTGDKITITNPRVGFYLMPQSGSKCEHPRDYIFMPWGYSPWIDGATSLSSCLPLLIASISFVLLNLTAHYQS